MGGDGGGKKVSLLLFANNFWMISDRPETLSVMISFCLQCLNECGWKCPLEDIKWATTAPDNLKVGVVVNGEVPKVDSWVPYGSLMIHCGRESYKEFARAFY